MKRLRRNLINKKAALRTAVVLAAVVAANAVYVAMAALAQAVK